MEDMNAAEEAYTAAMDAGVSLGDAAAAEDAAAGVMTDMGAPADMIDTMATAAQDVLTQNMLNDLRQHLMPQGNVDAAFGDGPPPGDMGPDQMDQWDHQKEIWTRRRTTTTRYGTRTRWTNGTTSR